jgi:hypothetical protein
MPQYLQPESLGTGLLGMLTRGPAMERNRLRELLRAEAAAGVDPAESLRRYGPQIFGPGFTPPPTKKEQEAEQARQLQSLAGEMFPRPRVEERPTGRYEVGPPLGEAEFLAPPEPTGRYLVGPPEGETELFGPTRYAEQPETYRMLPEGGIEPVPPRPVLGPPLREPIERRRVLGPELEPALVPRREPIERRRVIEPEVEPVTVPRPQPTFAELLTSRRPEEVAGFLKAYPELVKAQEAERLRRAREEFYEPEAPGAPPAVPAGPGAPAAPAPAAPEPTAQARATQLRARAQRRLDRLEQRPELLGTTEGKQHYELALKGFEAADKMEEEASKQVTRDDEVRFAQWAGSQADAAEQAGDRQGAIRWRILQRNPTQGAQWLKDQEAAAATERRGQVLRRLAGETDDPQLRQLYEVAAEDPKVAEMVQKHTETGRPIIIEGRAYRVGRTPEGGERLVELPGGPGPKVERMDIEGRPYQIIQTPEGPRVQAIPGAPPPKPAALTPDILTTIHDTGLDPRTGAPATPDVRQQAQRSVAGRLERQLQVARTGAEARAGVAQEQPIGNDAANYADPRGGRPPADMPRQDVQKTYVRVTPRERDFLQGYTQITRVFEPKKIAGLKVLFPYDTARLNQAYQRQIREGIGSPKWIQAFGLKPLSQEQIKQLQPILAQLDTLSRTATLTARALGETGNVATADTERVMQGLTGATTFPQLEAAAKEFRDVMDAGHTLIFQRREPDVGGAPAPVTTPGGASEWERID